MIHRFIDLFQAVVAGPNIVFLARESAPNDYHVLWKAGNLADPERFNETIVSPGTPLRTDFLADPERSPDWNSVVYCRVGHNQVTNRTSVRVVDWADTVDTELYFETAGNTQSLEPTWKPDGSKILFRAKGATATINLIKHMDPDGTNVATLYTGATLVVRPTYNSDGSLIVFTENGAIKTMNADGTSVATLVAASDKIHAAFMHSSDVVVYLDASGGTPGWRKINADGSGGTTLSTNFTVNDPTTIMWSLIPDDSAVVTSNANLGDPAPNRHLVYIATDGSGITAMSPQRSTFGGTPDTRPVVLGDRIYFPTNSPFTILSSTALDGSDFRTEFDGTAESPNVLFHGFRGDTVNI